VTDKRPVPALARPKGPTSSDHLYVDTFGAELAVWQWNEATWNWTKITITPDQAAHVLFHYGAGGMEAGSFTRALIALIARADTSNKARLALGFPGYVAAVILAADTSTGVEQLLLQTARKTTGPTAGQNPAEA
jgi:hypothetical protein